VKKEGSDELNASQLSWECVEPLIRTSAQLWYSSKLLLKEKNTSDNDNDNANHSNEMANQKEGQPQEKTRTNTN
jgi:hypothetical protein